MTPMSGTIIARVAAEAEAATDRFAGLRRIGIDDVSSKRGHKYLVIERPSGAQRRLPARH
jgi:hypothetical protein